jgi:sodium-dependent phosphate cotransporter
MDSRFDLDLNASKTHSGLGTIENLEIPKTKAEPGSVLDAKFISRVSVHLGKIILFILSLYLFILAISLMKTGARSLLPFIGDWFAIANGANSLGFGWFSAYIIMSGSPVAAAALTFFDAGTIDKLSAFTMITGSRLGASFIVLLLGFLYVLRGRNRPNSLSMGLLSLLVTATTYLPALLIGLLLLDNGLINSFQLQSGALIRSSIDQTVEPVIAFITGLFPNSLVFWFGLGIVMISFNLFDKGLPQITLEKNQLGNMSRLVYRPSVMFILGALVTLISMSVSLSLTLLVPLSNRGYVRRENIIPYIMGANITTFIDTLLAAVLLNNPHAFTIVFVEMISVTLISILILSTLQNPYRRAMIKISCWVTASNRNLVIFLTTIFVIPAILIFI